MDFPEHLKERIRQLNGDLQKSDGQFVLYWMHHAMRVEENPALDVARLLAAEYALPLLVYQELRSDDDYASDRHHTFVLEGVRDLERQMDAAGITYAFHVETRDHVGSYLDQLAAQASAIVTEDFPVEPVRSRMTHLLSDHEKPVFAVDASCVVPMVIVDKSFDRAFQYRRYTKKLYEDRVGREWPTSTSAVAAYPLDSLPFKPTRVGDVDPGEIVSRCRIDHSVGPVCDTIGGTEAGYARWEAFKEKGLKSYGKKRNDPLKHGVSRMSPYLHYGMVAATRLAREAHAFGGDGAEKYLDELLIWRELAFNYCFYHEDHDQFTTLPVWAHETLRNHADDLRSQVLSWEELARAKSGDLLWDAAQRSLLVQGELHNNVRMTWGKAFLEWTESPEIALQRLIDLNHRYALDGRDPASFGGILWCLGQFDRPFFPEQFVIGTVRPRPTSEHAKRLDIEKYDRICSTLRTSPRPKVAVVGAGISGLFAARALADHGVEVCVFEKSRGVGGRMATRRSDAWRFDHGAQYFTIRDSRLIPYVESWHRQGIVEPWDAPIVNLTSDGSVSSRDASADEHRWVPTPAMNSLCKHLASDLHVQVQTRIDRIAACDQEGHRRLQVIDDQGRDQGDYDYVLVTAPAGQAAEILRDFPSIAAPISEIKMTPCWATLAAFDRRLPMDWGGAFMEDDMLAWAARGSSRPNRDSASETLVLHATPEWTAQHLDLSREAVAERMLDHFAKQVDLKGQQPIDCQAHRWMFARAADLEGPLVYYDDSSGAAACGDWTNGERVEAALLSGMAAVGRLMGAIAANEKTHEPHDTRRPDKPLAQAT